MRLAIMHGLYGEDFVQEAILSIVDQVDEVLFLWAETPWFGITEVEKPGPVSGGFSTKVPCPVDNMLFRAMQLSHPKVRFQKFSPVYDVFTMHFAALEYIPRTTTYVIFTNGVDVIQCEGNIDKAIEEMRLGEKPAGIMRQRWAWKGLRHEAQMNTSPSGSLVYNMKEIGWNKQHLKNYFDENKMRGDSARLAATCWNVGFAYSYHTMKWRAEIRAAQVNAGMGYAMPRRDWVDGLWARWGETNYEVYEQGEHLGEVATIVPLEISELPLILQKRVNL